MLVLSVGRWGNFIRLSALVEIMFDLKIISFGYKDGSRCFRISSHLILMLGSSCNTAEPSDS